MRAREFIYTYDDIYYITENMKPMFVESLTSRFSNIIWKQNGQQFVGIGTFDKHSNQQFFINFTVFPYTFLNKKYRTVYIEFTRVIDGISTVELLDLNAADSNYIDPARVFGAIFNSILNKIKELNALYGIDAVAFTVDKNEIKRLSLYRRMLTRAHGNRAWNIVHTFSDDSYSGLLASKHVFNDDELSVLKTDLAKIADK